MIGKLIKWALLGIGALVVLAVVVGVLAVVIGGGGGGSAGGEGGGQAVNGTADSAGSANGKDYLELGGTPGIPVSCSVMHGDGRQTTIDAKVPQEIRPKGMDSFGSSTYNSCQKMGAKGVLKVAVVIDGKQETTNKTSAQYGVVNADYPQ